MEKLQTPPIRTPLAEGNGEPFGRNAATAKTAKEWYLYWRQAGEQVNDHTDAIAELGADLGKLENTVEALIRHGTHAQRLAAAPDPLDALWVETDRNNIVYQARLVATVPTWVYVTGAMYGTIIAVDQRPAGLGVNDTRLLFLSSDSTSVIWNGSAWKPVGSLLDIGAAPPVSQFRIKAAGLGGFAALAYSADNISLTFDAELDIPLGGWKALSGSAAWISKTATELQFMRALGLTPGSVVTLIQLGATLDLLTGNWNIAGAYQVGGVQVVKARMAAITAPSGGAVIDAQARAAIQSIINTLSAGAGGHGLIG